MLSVNPHIPVDDREIARLAVRDNALSCGRITHHRYKYTADGVVSKISQCSLSINTTRLESNSGTPARLELIEKWIKTCFENHPQCRQASQADHPGSCPSRLIDVTSPGRPKLVLKDDIPVSSMVYVTISHRWGDSRMPNLLRENIEAMKYEIVMESLPPVFRDAIQFCSRLRVKYLWIDALCLIQDDEADCKSEIQKMGGIYANAYCNLSATAAADFLLACSLIAIHHTTLSFPWTSNVKD